MYGKYRAVEKFHTHSLLDCLFFTRCINVWSVVTLARWPALKCSHPLKCWLISTANKKCRSALRGLPLTGQRRARYDKMADEPLASAPSRKGFYLP